MDIRRESLKVNHLLGAQLGESEDESLGALLGESEGESLAWCTN